MKGLMLVVFFMTTSIVGYSSCTGIIETIVTTLFTNCTEIKKYLGVTTQQLRNSTFKPNSENITVIVYGNSTLNKSTTALQNAGNVLWNNSSGFDTSLPTEIVIHGFCQFSNASDLGLILDGLIRKGGRNVILIDASVYIGYWYLYASTATRFIGELLGQELATLVMNGYKPKIHIIGFSLGAIIAGVAGQTFKNITQQTLPWITGLDPAGPCFFNSTSEERLDKTSAEFVDVVHTNMGVFGTHMQIGHVDFYPNGGEYQPNKFLPFYSHAFILYLYAESVNNVNAYSSVACQNWLLFLTGGCSWNSRTNMGYGVSKTAAGKYYLSTNGASPYSKGETGIPTFNFFAWIRSIFN